MTTQTNPPPPTLRLRVDGDALASNWRALDRLSGNASAGAAVKANCYGLGIAPCVPVLRDAGCGEFFVAHWSEVAAVVEHVVPSKVSVLHGPLNHEEVAYSKATGAVPVINSLYQAQLWTASGGGRCHLMVDTGMNRLGVSLVELSEPILQALEIDLLMSHMVSADEDSDLNARQLRDFRTATTLITHTRESLSNSAAIGLGRQYAFDLTRPGLSLYGGVPRPQLADHIRQVAFPEVAVLQMRAISAGDTVGYNATFTASRDMRIATVSLGYADGYLRSWGGVGELQRDRERLPVLGRVSMDMVIVDCTKAPDLREGDWLQVPYHLPHAAQQSTLTQYELLTVLGQRFG